MVGSVEFKNPQIARSNGSSHTYSNGSVQNNGISATSEERLDELRRRLGKSEGNLLSLSLLLFGQRKQGGVIIPLVFKKTQDLIWYLFIMVFHGS